MKLKACICDECGRPYTNEVSSKYCHDCLPVKVLELEALLDSCDSCCLRQFKYCEDTPGEGCAKETIESLRAQLAEKDKELCEANARVVRQRNTIELDTAELQKKDRVIQTCKEALEMCAELFQVTKTGIAIKKAISAIAPIKEDGI
jgi:hypothetical protein